LVASEPPPPTETPAAPEQQPRGFRRRRTTLPRSTRGWSRSIVWSLIGLTAFGVLYGLIARIDSSIDATGSLRPVKGVTDVSSPFSSLVKRVLVKDGQMVKLGQPLLFVQDQALVQQRKDLLKLLAVWRREADLLALQLDLPAPPPTTAENRNRLGVQVNEVVVRQMAAEQERLRAENDKRQQQIELKALQEKYKINQNITGRMETLVGDGAMSRLELDRQNERQVELMGNIQRTQQELNSAERRIFESTSREKLIPLANRKLLYSQYDNARQQLIETSSRLTEMDDRLRLGRITAPVPGRVFDLSVKVGELVGPNRPALKLVPAGKLQANLSVTNKDIGFLVTGMPVEVRVTSFPFTDYGALKGKILRIGADSLPPDNLNPQEHFPVVVSIDRDALVHKGERYDLRPGMAVTALIQTGTRPVIALISDRFTAFMESSRSIR
jgi:HlyD family secretion protein